MNIRPVSKAFSVSDQLAPTDVDALAAAGVKALVCNRPDGEAVGQPSFADIGNEAKRHGITVHYLPVVHDTISSQNVREFTALLQGLPQPTHAWCRSGLRSITLWSLSQLQQGTPVDAVVAQAAALGFDFTSFPVKFAGVIAELQKPA